MASIKRQLNGRKRDGSDQKSPYKRHDDKSPSKLSLGQKLMESLLKTSDSQPKEPQPNNQQTQIAIVGSSACMPQISPLIQKKAIRKTSENPSGVPKSSLKNAHRASNIETVTSGTGGLYRTISMNPSDPALNKSGAVPHKSQRFDSKLVAYDQDGNVSCYGCSDVASEKRRMARLLKSVNENLEKNELKEVINLYRHELKAQWTQLSQIIDTLLLYMFTLATAFLLFTLINQAPNAKIF